MTVSRAGCSIGRTAKFTARNVIPTNSTASRTAITSRVVAAFFASGGWNAGTPVAIASVPVSATAPDAKARRMRIRLSDSTAFWCCATCSGV
jgi:hypothetical protein